MRRNVVEAVWERRAPWARVAAAGLVPVTWPYAAVMAVRDYLYDTGRFAVHRVPARVVGVGNLTVGGSGKTPMTLWLAEQLAATGLRVAIVARGYRKRRRGVVIVGRSGEALVSARDGGDEAVLLARRFAGPVVVGEDRVAAARVACELLRAEIIVLDDGFQHRRLGRDFDVVLVANDPRRQRLLPAGPLRERPGALRRAGAIVGMEAPAAPWVAACTAANVPVFHAETRALALIDGRDPRWPASDLGAVAGRDVAVVAGIARPTRFIALLERLGARVCSTRLLDDHHVYDGADAAWIEGWAVRATVVTTEKDLVKLVELMSAPPVYALRIGVEVGDADSLVRLAAGEDVLCRQVRPERG